MIQAPATNDARRALFDGSDVLGARKPNERRCCIRKSDGCACMSKRNGDCSRCYDKADNGFADPVEVEGPVRRAVQEQELNDGYNPTRPKADKLQYNPTRPIAEDLEYNPTRPRRVASEEAEAPVRRALLDGKQRLPFRYIEGQQRCCIRKVDGCACLSAKNGDCSACNEQAGGLLDPLDTSKSMGILINPEPNEEDIGCSADEQEECNENGGVVMIRGQDCSCAYPDDGDEEEVIAGPGRRALDADMDGTLGIVKEDRRCCIRKMVSGCLCMSKRNGSCERCDKRFPIGFSDPAEIEDPF